MANQINFSSDLKIASDQLLPCNHTLDSEKSAFWEQVEFFASRYKQNIKKAVFLKMEWMDGWMRKLNVTFN